MIINAKKLREERDKRGMSQKDFASFLGVGFRTYQNYEAGRTIPETRKELISYKISENIVNDENDAYVKPEAIWVEYDRFMLVPLVGTRAQAGFLSGWGDPEYIEDLPKIPWEVDREYKGKYVCFEVSGDSMDDGSSNALLEGDILLCREINKVHWSNKLHTHNWDYFVIVHKYDGILVKEITNHHTETGKLKLHSLNNFYDDIMVEMKDLIAIFNVVTYHRKPRKR